MQKDDLLLYFFVFSNESVEKSAHIVMLQYLHELKKVPIETVAEQVTFFVTP